MLSCMRAGKCKLKMCHLAATWPMLTGSMEALHSGMIRPLDAGTVPQLHQLGRCTHMRRCTYDCLCTPEQES